LELIQNGTLCRYCALDPTDGGVSSRQVLTGEWHRHSDDGYTRVSAYAQHYELRLWSDFTFFENDPVHGDQFEQQESRNMVGGSIVQGWHHTLLGNDSTTEVGLQVRHDHIGVDLFDTQARSYLSTVSNDHVNETETGLYVQNSTGWTPWLRTLVGLRADHIDMHVNAIQTPANSGNGSGSKLSPKLSVILGPWAKTEFFVNAGRGFHSNDARGVTGKVDPVSGESVEPVPALVASRGAEIGMRSEWIPGLQTSLALWRLDSDSELVYSADAGGTEANDASKRYGLEWNNHLVLNRWLLVDADMAWTHARFVGTDPNGDTGNYIPNAVGKVGLVGITAHDLGPWSVGFITRYIGAYPLSQDGKLMNPAAAVSSLKIKRDFGPQWSVSLDVLNLFDRKFYDIAYEQDYRVAPNAPINPDGVTVHPGEPREFRVTLAVKL
jgi:outer membrane receptor protein involved in Fe transport